MSIIHPDWSVRNSTRKFPLDDTASTVSDDNKFLPASFLVDCNIWAPEVEFDGGHTLEYLYLGAATVTANQVSLTILGTAGPAVPVTGDPVGQQESPFVPLATVSVLISDLVPYKNYAIVAMYPGVTGWVMFGQLHDSEPFSMLFSTPQQSMLAPKIARFYAGLPTPGITVGALRNLLVGDVELLMDAPITAEITDRVVEGHASPYSIPVIEIKMVGADGAGLPEKDTMEEFAGKCGLRPESGTCNRSPVQRITGVSPDIDGSITAEFDGVSVRRYQDGVCIDSTQGLADACAGVTVDPAVVACDIVLPYTNTFADTADLVTFTGYTYTDAGDLYLVPGGYPDAAAGTCLLTLDTGVAIRAFTLTLSGAVAAGAAAGQYFCDSGSYRVVVLSTGDVYAENKFTEVQIPLGSAAVSNPMTVLVSSSGTIGGVTIPAPYWVPSGGTGIIAYTEEMTFSQYEVSDA